MTKADRVMQLVHDYAHEHWASDRTINRKEDEESQAEMSRIEAEIRKLVEDAPRPHANDCDCATCIMKQIEADKKGGK